MLPPPSSLLSLLPSPAVRELFAPPGWSSALSYWWICCAPSHVHVAGYIPSSGSGWLSGSGSWAWMEGKGEAAALSGEGWAGGLGRLQTEHRRLLSGCSGRGERHPHKSDVSTGVGAGHIEMLTVVVLLSKCVCVRAVREGELQLYRGIISSPSDAGPTVLTGLCHEGQQRYQ